MCTLQTEVPTEFLKGQSSYAVPTQQFLWRWKVCRYFVVTLRLHMQVLPHAQLLSHEFGWSHLILTIMQLYNWKIYCWNLNKGMQICWCCKYGDWGYFKCQWTVFLSFVYFIITIIFLITAWDIMKKAERKIQIFITSKQSNKFDQRVSERALLIPYLINFDSGDWVCVARSQCELILCFLLKVKPCKLL